MGRKSADQHIREVQQRVDEVDKQMARVEEEQDQQHARIDQLSGEVFEQAQELIRRDHRLAWVEKHVEQLVGKAPPKPRGT